MSRIVEITKELSYFPERFRTCNVFLLKGLDQVILFDPSLSVEQAVSDRPVTMLIATHAHYDHIGSLDKWKEARPDLPFLMHAADIPMLDDPAVNASMFFGRPASFPHPDRTFEEGDRIELDQLYSLRVYNTPGHTMGSCCFLILKGEEEVPVALLTGDTLFDRGWGRTDFVTGSDALMRRSLERLYGLLSGLPPDLPVCPGHASMTTAALACRFLQLMGFTDN